MKKIGRKSSPEAASQLVRKLKIISLFVCHNLRLDDSIIAKVRHGKAGKLTNVGYFCDHCWMQRAPALLHTHDQQQPTTWLKKT